NFLFDADRQLESLWAIEEWANDTTDGSLASLPVLPDPSVWDKVCAEHGNCLGKKCKHYEPCFWQAAKRRMQGGNVLVVNHALFFADLALRMVGVNYLPKYDLVVLDEAHTVEDVAEVGSLSEKVKGMAETIDGILGQSLEDAVYWFEIAGRTPTRVSLHAAPINVAEGLRKYLFEKLPSVVMTSATLCTKSDSQ